MVESSVFGAEFIAMKLGIETLRGTRYELRMMGVPIDGPSYVYGDNMSLIKNCSKPDSQLNKKNISICCHFVHEAVAMGEVLIAHAATDNNWGELATKILPNGITRDRHVDRLLHDVESQSKVSANDEANPGKPTHMVRKVLKVSLSPIVEDEYIASEEETARTATTRSKKKRKTVKFNLKD